MKPLLLLLHWSQLHVSVCLINQACFLSVDEWHCRCSTESTRVNKARLSNGPFLQRGRDERLCFYSTQKQSVARSERLKTVALVKL